jgi:hypothetical protein
MDFRVTHFLVADSTATNGIAGATDLGAAADVYGIKGRLALLNPFAANPTSTVGTAALANTPIQIAQILDNTDDIEKELGMIKTGIISAKNLISVRKLIGNDDYTRQVKFFGNNIKALPTGTPVSSTVWAAAGNPTLNTYWHVLASGSNPSRLYQVTSAGTSGATAPTHLSGTGGSGTAVYTFIGLFNGTTAPIVTFGGNAVEDYDFGGIAASTVSGLSIDVDKEYSFSVRMRSFVANTISPYGYLRGYSALASNVYVNPTTGVLSTNSAYASFSAMFGIVKQFAEDKTIDKLAKVHAILTYAAGSAGTVARSFVLSDSTTLPTYLNATQGGQAPVVIDVTQYSSWHEALAALVTPWVPGTSSNYDNSSATGAGSFYSATLVAEALEQTGFFNSADLTQFPFRFDSVKLNGYFQEGPYHDRLAFTGNSQPLNSGITTQTPVVYDRTASGTITSGSIAINALISNSLTSTAPLLIPSGNGIWFNSTGSGYIPQGEMKFPNLMQNEVKYLAHEYQSYALKYKQQFKGVRYNALLSDPTQAKVNFAGPYVLYFVEYMPNETFAYTSTQPMTQLSIIAVPVNLSTTIANLDTIFGSAVTIAYPGASTEVSA